MFVLVKQKVVSALPVCNIESRQIMPFELWGMPSSCEKRLLCFVKVSEAATTVCCPFVQFTAMDNNQAFVSLPVDGYDRVLVADCSYNNLSYTKADAPICDQGLPLALPA